MFHSHIGIKVDTSAGFIDAVTAVPGVREVITDGDSFLCWGEALGVEEGTGESVQHYIVVIPSPDSTAALAVQALLLEALDPFAPGVLLYGRNGTVTTAHDWSEVITERPVIHKVTCDPYTCCTPDPIRG